MLDSQGVLGYLLDMRKEDFTAAQKAKIKEFFEAGKKSFLNGGKGIPAQNKDFMDLLKANPMPIGQFALATMKAFVDGWTYENLIAPVPGWSKEENDALLNLDRSYFKKYED